MNKLFCKVITANPNLAQRSVHVKAIDNVRLEKLVTYNNIRAVVLNKDIRSESPFALNLSESEDLICKNLMCEKLDEVCICKLARWISINGSALENLEALELENNGLTILPDSLFDLKKVKYLNLRHNSLTDFPEGIARLDNLKILDISHNKLHGEMPDFLTTMMDNEHIKNAKTGTKILQNLEMIYVHNNDELTIQKEIENAWDHDNDNGILFRKKNRTPG